MRTKFNSILKVTKASQRNLKSKCHERFHDMHTQLATHSFFGIQNRNTPIPELSKNRLSLHRSGGLKANWTPFFSHKCWKLCFSALSWKQSFVSTWKFPWRWIIGYGKKVTSIWLMVLSGRASGIETGRNTFFSSLTEKSSLNPCTSCVPGLQMWQRYV